MVEILGGKAYKNLRANPSPHIANIVKKRGVSKVFKGEVENRELQSSNTGLSGLRQPSSSLALSI